MHPGVGGARHRIGLRRARPAARRRRPLAAVPRVLRAAEEHHRRRRPSRQRAARRREPHPLRRRAPRAARRRAVLRRREGGLPRGALRALPCRPAADASRARAPVGGCAAVLRRVRLDAASPTPNSRPTTCSARWRRSSSRRGRRGAALHRRPRHVPVRLGPRDGAVSARRQGRAGDHRPGRGTRALRDRARAGPRLHRAARRSVRRAAGRQGHRREGRARPAARARHARRGHRSGAPAGHDDAADGGRADERSRRCCARSRTSPPCATSSSPRPPDAPTDGPPRPRPRASAA